jgi:hypothetical protein
VSPLKHLTEKEFNRQLKVIEIDNASKLREQILKTEKNKYKHKIKLPSTGKLMAVYLFLILNVILAYAMYMMYHFADLTFLGALITDIAAQVLVFISYNIKSKAENTTGGIVFETAMADLKNKFSSDLNNNNSNGDDQAVG